MKLDSAELPQWKPALASEKIFPNLVGSVSKEASMLPIFSTVAISADLERTTFMYSPLNLERTLENSLAGTHSIDFTVDLDFLATEPRVALLAL